MPVEPDVTPEGDSIDVHVRWVRMPDGSERPLVLDMTKVNAAMRRIDAVLDRFRASLDDARDD